MLNNLAIPFFRQKWKLCIIVWHFPSHFKINFFDTFMCFGQNSKIFFRTASVIVLNWNKFFAYNFFRLFFLYWFTNDPLKMVGETLYKKINFIYWLPRYQSWIYFKTNVSTICGSFLNEYICFFLSLLVENYIYLGNRLWRWM